MNLCTYSRSEVYSHQILPECPLALTSAEKQAGCPCHTRIWLHDLRVSECKFPNTWADVRIEDPERLVRSLREGIARKKTVEADKKRRKKAAERQRQQEAETPKAERPKQPELTFEPEPQAETEPMSETATATPNANQEPAPSAGALAKFTPAMMTPSIYDRIADPLDFIFKFGKAMAASCMFGAKNDQQGMVLAMACLTERQSTLVLARRYHIIGGNMSMKSSVMLAEFRQRGGDHNIIERSADRAEIELISGRKKYKFAFTFEQAKVEDYVFAKDGKTFKDNWSTPRRRMQMLWARCVSDSIDAVCPEVKAGYYTPEELGGIEQPEPNGDEATDAIDVPFVFEQPMERKSVATTTATEIEQPDLKAAAENLVAAQGAAPVTREQLVEMKRIKDSLGDGLPEATWRAALKKVGGDATEKASQLSFTNANRVIDWLLKRANAGKAQTSLDQFANNLLKQPQGVGA